LTNSAATWGTIALPAPRKMPTELEIPLAKGKSAEVFDVDLRPAFYDLDLVAAANDGVSAPLG